MLNGNLNCKDTQKLLLQYIHFNLNRKDMGRIATHLRNCPKCFNQYSKLQKRKKELLRKMHNIEEKLRIQNQVSEHYDNECSEELNLALEIMLKRNEAYKIELLKNQKITELLKKFKEKIETDKKEYITKQAFEKIKMKKYPILLFLQPLRHVLLKLQ